MNRPLRVLPLLVLGALLSCERSPSTAPSRCLAVALEPDGLTVDPARHSLVSVFFSVTCDGEPVSGLAAESFRISEDGDLSSTFEAQPRIVPRGQKFRLYTVLLLDMSGSLVKTPDFPALLASADRFVDEVLAADAGERLVAIYTFDGAAGITLRQEFTSSAGALHQAIQQVGVVECQTDADCPDAAHATCATFAAGGGGRCVDVSTNLYGAVVAGLDRLDDAKAPDANPGILFREGALLVLTDGTDQASLVSPTAAAQAITATRNRVFTIGLGGEVDAGALRQLGKDGFVPAAAADDLGPAFERVAQRIAGLANQFYLLEYCSPRRGGIHTLTLTAEQGERTGALSAVFDADGFTSGCALP